MQVHAGFGECSDDSDHQMIIPQGLMQERPDLNGEDAELRRVDEGIAQHSAQSETRAVDVTVAGTKLTCESPCNTSPTYLTDMATFTKHLHNADTAQEKVFWMEHIIA